jgi:hypothetical protein
MLLTQNLRTKTWMKVIFDLSYPQFCDFVKNNTEIIKDEKSNN